MGSRTFVVAAAVAVALAGYAVYTTTTGKPTARTGADASGEASASKATPRSSGASRVARPHETSPPVARAAPQPDRRDGATDDDADPVATKTAFDYGHDRFDDAVKRLREAPTNDANVPVLLQQARMAIKDMEATLDPETPGHRRDVTRATETLARLEARREK